jgi:ABC-type nitrate/sulfonate/bicarbonate transport system substrate-binding protein
MSSQLFRSERKCIKLLAMVLLAQAITNNALAQTSPGTQAPIKGDGGTIRLLINPSGSQSFPGFTIKRYGLDKKYGFELQTIPSQTAQSAVVAMQSGGAEIGAWNWPDAVRMTSAGTKVIGIGPVMKWANTVVTPAKSTIQTMPDLKGKKFGVIHRTGLDWIVMRAVARKVYGFDIESALTMQEGAVHLLRGLLDQGQLDASIMYNDFTPGMVSSGQYRQVLRIKDLVNQLGIPDAPYILFAAQLDYASRHPANIRAFLAAYREAVGIMNSDDNVWVEAAKTLKIVDPDIVAKFRDQTRPLFVPAFSPDAEADIRRTFDVLVETSGPALFGMSKLPDNFMTLTYQ